ncbi:MAG: SAM-dependent chlorinase/fluorinase [Myxococcota bacterium]
MGVLALSTDFGADSTYVAQMKGVVLSRLPDARIIDVSHSLPAHNVRAAEILLRSVAFAFPLGTVHVVVVDPGVGTQRKPIALTVRGMTFVGPDNGVFGRLLSMDGAEAVWLDKEHVFQSPVAPTFHGRDIFAPVAAELAGGCGLEEVGSPVGETVASTLPEPDVDGAVSSGEVLSADRFGNLTTNIHCPHGARYRVSLEGRSQPLPWVSTYGEVEPGTLVALVGSDGFLELARREMPADLAVGTRIIAERISL